MNNKDFNQILREKSKVLATQAKVQAASRKKATGFTDSEEEDSKSLKSPKSARSNLSARSSLSSTRSPRDDFGTTLRRPNQLGIMKPSSQNQSLANSEDDETERSMRRGENRFAKEKSLSPRSSDRSDGSTPRNLRLAKTLDTRPKKPEGNMDLMATMRKPMTSDDLDTLTSTRRGEEYGFQRGRVATPTKLGMTQKTMTKTPVAAQRRHPNSIIDENLDEEESGNMSLRSASRGSGRTTPTGANIFTRQRVDSQSPSKASPRSFSPRDSMDPMHSADIDADKNEFNKQTKLLSTLLDPKPTQPAQDADAPAAEKHAWRKQSYDDPEKDPDVIETLEDTRISEKLRKEREQKKLLRETRAKTQTEDTKKIEEAIEKVENTMDDSIRLGNLKEKNDKLAYPTKPVFSETRVLEKSGRPPRRAQSARTPSTRQRRASTSEQPFERKIKDKYAYVKPKTMTRVPVSARTQDEFTKLNDSKQDVFNDSYSLRQQIYNEWYQKKLVEAKKCLKEARLSNMNEEEQKAQERIEKLQKSKLVFEAWNAEKQKYLKERKKFLEEQSKKIADEKEKEAEKKIENKVAYEQWLKNKIEYLKEKKQEDLDAKRAAQKKARKEKTVVKDGKPPLPFNDWAKQKEEEINEKTRLEQEKKRQKEKEEQLKRQKKRLAQAAYEDWLDKKDRDEDLNRSRGLNKSLSASMSSLPPFYPASKTIPFGR